MRSNPKANGWTGDMQRMFIVWLAHSYSPTNACDELGKARSGIDKVYKSPSAEEFLVSRPPSSALTERRRIARVVNRRTGAVPCVSRRTHVVKLLQRTSSPSR